MTYQLVPIDRGNTPLIPLQRPVLLVGRHPECDVRIELAKISRRHCCLAIAYDRVLIRDLGSRNGIRLNGRLIEEAQLVEGDEVAIGPLLYRLVAETPQTPVAGKPSASSTRKAPEPGSAPGPSSTAPQGRKDVDDGDLVPLDDLD